MTKSELWTTIGQLRAALIEIAAIDHNQHGAGLRHDDREMVDIATKTLAATGDPIFPLDSMLWNEK